MTLLKRLRRRPVEYAPKQRLRLKVEDAECTCPEPCERDHENE